MLSSIPGDRRTPDLALLDLSDISLAAAGLQNSGPAHKFP